MPNTIPLLLNTLRPTLRTVSEWTGASLPVVNTWQQGAYQPKPEKRKALVVAVRRHAAKLLRLAKAVEREAPASPARRGAGSGARGHRRVPQTIHRGSAARSRGGRRT